MLSQSIADKDIQHVSSLGGPRVMLPTSDIHRWIDGFGDLASPDATLYDLACSIDDYCGVVSPWGTQLVIFGNDPSDIFYFPNHHDGLLVRWVGADSLSHLRDFAIGEADTDSWDERLEFTIVDEDMTLMDTCGSHGDKAPRIRLAMRTGKYTICSRYAENLHAMAIIHRLEYVG